MVEENTLRSLLYSMLRIRRVEEVIVDLYPEQEMRCPVHLCIGQEAVSAGVCENLSKEDLLFSNHRAHGHYLAKGGDLKAMFAEMYGKVTGCSKGKGGSMHLIDLSVNVLGTTPIVGGIIPVAVGAAFGSVMQNKNNVTVVFFGDAAAETGSFHESLNFAALKNLPVIFICENNLYSVYSPLSVRQPPREIFLLAKGHGIDSLQVDGNNVVEIYEVSREAIDNARKGGGPKFLECKTYRWREHCGPNYDHDLGYRTQSEFEAWRGRCPIESLKENILRNGIITDKQIEAMSKEIQDEINEAVSFAKESPFPSQDLLFEDIYAGQG